MRNLSRTNDSPPDRRTVSSPRAWPASPLAVVGRAFDVLVAPPTVYALDVTGLNGLPDGLVRVDVLRRLLLSRQVVPAVRDIVWRELVDRTRRPAPEGQAWTVIAAGMALPGLTSAAAAVTRGCHGDTADIDAEMLAAFVTRLTTLDPTGPRVLGRLLDAAVRAGRKARAGTAPTGGVRVERAFSRPPARPWDHPDWVLVRAVAAGVLDLTEARLIGTTRLEEVSLVQAAAALEIDPSMAADWRWRAESRLRQALRSGELDLDRPLSSSAERRRAVRLALVRADRARRRPARRAPAGPGAAGVSSSARVSPLLADG